MSNSRTIRFNRSRTILLLTFFLNAVSLGVSYEFDCSHPNSVSICNTIEPPVIPPEGMTEEYMDAKCIHLRDGNECLLQHARLCLEAGERNYTEVVLSGMVELQKSLCEDRTYRENYVKYHNCRSSSVIDCRVHMRPALNIERAPAGEYSQEETINITCSSYEKFMNCSEDIVDYRCGPVAAAFVKGYLRTLHGNYLKTYCPPAGYSSLVKRHIRKRHIHISNHLSSTLKHVAAMTLY